MNSDSNHSRKTSMFRKIFRGDVSKETRNLFMIVFSFVTVGTIFYRIVEDWRWIDSFYFTVTTLTTVGYGDFVPTTDIGKLFTTGLIFGGLGVVLTFLQTLAREQAKEPFFSKLLNRIKPEDND